MYQGMYDCRSMASLSNVQLKGAENNNLDYSSRNY